MVRYPFSEEELEDLRARRYPRIAAHRADEEARAVFGEMGAGVDVPRQGAPYKKAQMSRAMQPYLTERQRTVLKGKVRMSDRWARMEQIMEETGMSLKEFVAQLSVEELVRGRFKDVNGGFRGRPPKWVPREFHRACLEELMKRGRDMWQKNYLVAIEAMTEIAAGRGDAGRLATPGERIKAAQFVIERMEGKVPEKLVVTADEKWQTVMHGIVAEVSPEALERGRKALEASQDFIEGEVVATEELDEDDWEDDDYDPDEEETEAPPMPVRSRRRK